MTLRQMRLVGCWGGRRVEDDAVRGSGADSAQACGVTFGGQRDGRVIVESGLSLHLLWAVTDRMRQRGWVEGRALLTAPASIFSPRYLTSSCSAWDSPKTRF